MLYFFLSYGRNCDNQYVEQFFGELSDEVRAQAGISGNPDVGFLDTVSIRPGELPWDAITRAVAECRVFIPLYSPRFFNSVACGREWAAFDRRIARQTATGGRRPEGLLPIEWRPGPLHAVATRVQYRRAGDRGLSHLYRLRDIASADSRTVFVDALAADIVRIAEAEEPLAIGDRLETVDLLASAFGMAETSDEVRAQQQARGPGFLHAVLASAGAGVMSTIRKDTSCYGDVINDWRPYHPRTERVVEVIEACGMEKGFHPHLTGVGRLGDRLTDARRHNEVVALVADPWASCIDGHRCELADFDRGQNRATPMFVPWSLTDVETGAKREALTSRLAGIMPAAHRMDLLNREDIGVFDEFEKVVAAEIGSAWDHVLQAGEPRRTVPGEQPAALPVIEVP